MRELISKRLSSEISTEEVIQGMIEGYGFLGEWDLIRWFKESKFHLYFYFGKKYYKRILEEIAIKSNGNCYDKIFGDKYNLYSPEQLIQMYLKEGKGLVEAINLSSDLFLYMIKSLRHTSHSLKVRRRLP
jgi:hypothetical protein